MNAKMTAVALAMTLGLAAGAANAAPKEVTKNGGKLIQFGDSHLPYTGSSFTDAFTFNPTFNGSITGASVTMGFDGKDIDTQLTSFTLVNLDTSTVIKTGSITQLHGVDAQGLFNNVAFTQGTHYALDVTGKVLDTDGGSFVGNVHAVPEPGEWAMMGSGLALLGFIAARRRSAV